MQYKSAAIYFIVFVGSLILGLLMWRFPYVMSSEDNFGHLLWSLALLAALIPAAIHRYGSQQAFKYASVWVGIFFVLLVGYSYREDLDNVANKVRSNVLPFEATQQADGTVTFYRANGGHFLIEGFVNHVPVQFMVDTGASKIALTIPDAKRLGFDVDNLSFTEPMHTANGLTFGAPVRIAEMTVGNISVRDIPASVCQNLSQPSLLGMSFLQKLKGFKIEGDRLTLEVPMSH